MGTSRNRLAVAVALAAAASSGAASGAAPAAGAYPDLSLGDCQDAGRIVYAPAPFKGYPNELLRSNATLATEHRTLLAGEEPWARDLMGVSGRARLYEGPDQARVLVVVTCKPHECDESRLYGVRQLGKPAVYGVVLVRDRKARPLGRFTAASRAALACVAQLEARQRGEVSRLIDATAPSGLPR